MALTHKVLEFTKATYVDLGPVGSFGLDGDFTIEMHFTLTYGGTADLIKPFLGIGIAATAEELATGKSLVLRGSSTGALLANISGGSDVQGVTHVGGSMWLHAALRYTRQTQELAIFLNGELEKQMTSCGNFSPDPSSRVVLGRSNLATGYLWGRIAEVRFFSAARTQRQIKADMFRRLTGTEDDLVSYFPLDGIAEDGISYSTTTARDAKVLLDPITRSALATTRPAATIYNGSWQTSNLRPLQQPVAADGTSTRVLVGEFDGAKSHVRVPHDAGLTPSQLTVQAWVRPTGTGRPYYTFPVVSKHGPGQGWELRAGGGRCGFLIAVNGVYHDLNVPLENDVWHVVAGVFDGVTMRLHVNGVLRASKAVSGTITPYTGDMNIGRNPYWTAHCFAGQIGQVHISSTQWYTSWLCLYMFTSSSSYNFDSWGSPRAVYRMQGDAQNYATSYTTSFIGTPQNVGWVLSDPPFLPSATAPTETTQYTDLDTTLALSVALETQRAALQSQLDDEKRAHADTTAQTVALGNQLDTVTQTRDALASRIAFLETLPGEIATEEAAIAALEAEIQQIKSPRGQISLADFVKKAHSEVQTARQALAASGGRYAFARMNLEVKMLPAPDGANMLFPELVDVQAIGADKLSTLNIGFEANDSMAITAAQVEVPSVIGTTEALAKRTLAARELAAETSYQAIAASSSSDMTEADRVVTQYPKAGSMVPVGSKVTMFLGREA